MRDLHCFEDTCTMDPPQTVMSGSGLVINDESQNVIPYKDIQGQMNSIKTKKRRTKTPLKGSGSKKSPVSRKPKSKRKGQKAKQHKKNSKTRKSVINLKALKTLLKTIKKSTK